MDAQAPTVAQLQAELDALRAQMQAFTAVISHDLRAPLRHILSFAALVEEDAGPQLTPEVQGFLQTIRESAQQLQRMLDALLQLSRLGTQALQPVPVALDGLVAQLRAELASDSPAAVWQVAAGLPTLQTDPQLLGVALRAVLGNALKFSAGRDPARVRLEATCSAEGVTLTVQDNGVGYNPALQERLFQPFCRLHSAREFEGLGMGLAQAHKCMERLGGRIALQSVPDQGCTVQLQLPA